MHMNNALVGKRIKRLRLKNKMTREELAEAANISVSFIYEIETGKKGFSVWTLRRLTEALKGNCKFPLRAGRFMLMNRKTQKRRLQEESR